jgi:hypothetical protein
MYALPNGNSIAQTMGKRINTGDDWHHDIQHIGAQTRFLRARLHRNVAVIYLEADTKSWPAWRKSHSDKSIGEMAANLYQTVSAMFPSLKPHLVLSGHSGGGSFIFGYINSCAQLPPWLERIAFLDADYGYEPQAGHTKKLAEWLNADERHFFCVLAYDDAAALLNGKPFVTPAGGTWGKSHLMQREMGAIFKFNCATNEQFETCSALVGRLQLILKTNPEKKILHTVQVERNGFIHGMVSGTTNESKGYEYFGDRAYADFIKDE